MKKIILDTNILIKYPKLLGLNIDDTIFIITVDVLNELKLRSSQSISIERGLLIDQAVEHGSVKIVNSSLPEVSAGYSWDWKIRDRPDHPRGQWP